MAPAIGIVHKKLPFTLSKPLDLFDSLENLDTKLFRRAPVLGFPKFRQNPPSLPENLTGTRMVLQRPMAPAGKTQDQPYKRN